MFLLKYLIVALICVTAYLRQVTAEDQYVINGDRDKRTLIIGALFKKFLIGDQVARNLLRNLTTTTEAPPPPETEAPPPPPPTRRPPPRPRPLPGVPPSLAHLPLLPPRGTFYGPYPGSRSPYGLSPRAPFYPGLGGFGPPPPPFYGNSARTAPVPEDVETQPEPAAADPQPEEQPEAQEPPPQQEQQPPPPPPPPQQPPPPPQQQPPQQQPPPPPQQQPNDSENNIFPPQGLPGPGNFRPQFPFGFQGQQDFSPPQSFGGALDARSNFPFRDQFDYQPNFGGGYYQPNQFGSQFYQ